MFETLPSSFVLAPAPDEHGITLGTGGSSEVYEATFGGRCVAIKTFGAANADGCRKVGDLFLPLSEVIHIWLRAPCQRSYWVEMASPREHSAICWRFSKTSAFFHCVRTNGEWKCHEIHQGSPKLQPPAPG